MIGLVAARRPRVMRSSRDVRGRPLTPRLAVQAHRVLPRPGRAKLQDDRAHRLGERLRLRRERGVARGSTRIAASEANVRSAAVKRSPTSHFLVPSRAPISANTRRVASSALAAFASLTPYIRRIRERTSGTAKGRRKAWSAVNAGRTTFTSLPLRQRVLVGEEARRLPQLDVAGRFDLVDLSARPRVAGVELSPFGGEAVAIEENVRGILERDVLRHQHGDGPPPARRVGRMCKPGRCASSV